MSKIWSSAELTVQKWPMAPISNYHGFYSNTLGCFIKKMQLLISMVKADCIQKFRLNDEDLGVTVTLEKSP
jgi:hypothetical protein